MLPLSLFVLDRANTAIPGEENPSEDQAFQAPAHSPYPRVARSGLRDDHEAAAIAEGSTRGEEEEQEITNDVGRIVLRP